MTRVLTIAAACLTVASSAAGQLSARDSVAAVESLPLRVPDEEDIVSRTLSSSSPYYYPAMMMRYMAGDLSLTAEHYYYLYYGYAYDDDYDAHRELPGEAAIHDILVRTKTPSREEALALIEAAKENMLADPFSPGNVNLMTWAYQLVGDTLNAVLSADRYRKVVAAIRSSGTGVKESSPWHILRFSHASDLAAAQGLRIVNRQVRTVDVEYLQFDRNRQGVKGWFFNFERIYWKPFDGKRKAPRSRWMINGTPVGRRKK